MTDSERKQVDNPLFARLYTRVIARGENAEMRALRGELLAGLRGRVVEIGPGPGPNFPLYPPEVTEVVAVEPEPYLREQARAAAAKAPVPITVVDGIADAIPLPDGACDGAVACLMLCSVPDQARALAELRRVLAPGGELRYFEHVRAHAAPAVALQRIVDATFWPHAFGGCHTARDTPAAIAAAGFAIESQRRLRINGLSNPPPVAMHALGTARRTS